MEYRAVTLTQSLAEYPWPAKLELEANGYSCTCSINGFRTPGGMIADSFRLRARFAPGKKRGRIIGGPLLSKNVWWQKPRLDGSCPIERTRQKMQQGWEILLQQARSTEECWIYPNGVVL